MAAVLERHDMSFERLSLGSCDSMSSAPPMSQQLHQLNDKWVLYHHLPSEKDWTLAGYKILDKNISTVEHVTALINVLPEKMIKYSMMFFMRDGITPLWEDPKNRTGGCFSYKVFNKHVEQVWKDMMCLVSGESIVVDSVDCKCVNGITISPKKNFCIIKIWICDMEHQDPKIVNYVENLTRHGSVFKTHDG
jgi:hypothetical protein